jgi:hypothetical protein
VIELPPARNGKLSLFRYRLEVAAYNGSVDMFQVLLDAEPEVLDKSMLWLGNSLSYAAIGGKRGIFEFVLDKWKALCPCYSMGNPRLFTPFPADYERAPSSEPEDILYQIGSNARLRRVDMVRYFLNKGACLNFPGWKRRDVSHNITDRWIKDLVKPLMAAIRSRNEEIVQLMLEHGADPNWYTLTDTALMAAVTTGNPAIVRMLVESGAKVNDGIPTPIIPAVRSENMEIFRYLRDKGAVLDSPETST